MKKLLLVLPLLALLLYGQATKTTTIRLSETRPIEVNALSLLVLEPSPEGTRLVPYTLGYGIIVNKEKRTLEGVNQSAWITKDVFDTTNATSIFTLTKEPAVPAGATVDVYHNGKFLAEGADYTLSGRTLTLLMPVVSGDRVIAKYFATGVGM